MSVEVLGVANEIDGHGDSMEAFRSANDQNANHLLNVTEGKKKNTPRPLYNPNHPDNQWPKMRYHAEKGQLTIGKSTKGVDDARQKAQIVKDNEAALKAAEAEGWRSEPYQKPQIAVLDPAVEKVRQQQEMTELRGQLVAMQDMVAKLLAKKTA